MDAGGLGSDLAANCSCSPPLRRVCVALASCREDGFDHLSHASALQREYDKDLILFIDLPLQFQV